MFLNYQAYFRCPMATYLESIEERHLVNVYFECRKHSKYPADGSWGQQTQFAVELFEFLDNVVAETNNKNSESNKSKKN